MFFGDTSNIRQIRLFSQIHVHNVHIYKCTCSIAIQNYGKIILFDDHIFQMGGKKKTNFRHCLEYPLYPEASTASFPDLKNWNHLNLTWKEGRFGPSFKLSKELVCFCGNASSWLKCLCFVKIPLTWSTFQPCHDSTRVVSRADPYLEDLWSISQNSQAECTQ